MLKLRHPHFHLLFSLSYEIEDFISITKLQCGYQTIAIATAFINLYKIHIVPEKDTDDWDQFLLKTVH